MRNGRGAAAGVIVLVLAELLGTATLAGTRPSEGPASVVRVCSNTDGAGARDALPVLTISNSSANEEVYVFTSVWSGLFPAEVSEYCGTPDYGVQWTSWGRRGSGFAAETNQTATSDYPGDNDLVWAFEEDYGNGTGGLPPTPGTVRRLGRSRARPPPCLSRVSPPISSAWRSSGTGPAGARSTS